MGDIADGIIEGDFCQTCGQYMEDDIDHAHACTECVDNIEPQTKKERNLEWSTNHLKDLDINYESKNNGVHLIVKHNGHVVDYWPSTGMYAFRPKPNEPDRMYKRGIHCMLKDLKK